MEENEIMPKKVPCAKVKPNNFLTKILWVYLKLNVRIEYEENPIIKQAKEFQPVSGLMPKVPMEKRWL